MKAPAGWHSLLSRGINSSISLSLLNEDNEARVQVEPLSRFFSCPFFEDELYSWATVIDAGNHHLFCYNHWMAKFRPLRHLVAMLPLLHHPLDKFGIWYKFRVLRCMHCGECNTGDGWECQHCSCRFCKLFEDVHFVRWDPSEKRAICPPVIEIMGKGGAVNIMEGSCTYMIFASKVSANDCSCRMRHRMSPEKKVRSQAVERQCVLRQRAKRYLRKRFVYEHCGHWRRTSRSCWFRLVRRGGDGRTLSSREVRKEDNFERAL